MDLKGQDVAYRVGEGGGGGGVFRCLVMQEEFRCCNCEPALAIMIRLSISQGGRSERDAKEGLIVLIGMLGPIEPQMTKYDSPLEGQLPQNFQSGSAKSGFA